MMNVHTKKLSVALLAATLAAPTLLAGCASMSNTERGAAIGRQTGSTARGAIIGAVLGGAAGAVIGRRMDRQAQELEGELGEGADVTRIGEGIAVTFASGILFPFDRADILPA